MRTENFAQKVIYNHQQVKHTNFKTIKVNCESDCFWIVQKSWKLVMVTFLNFKWSVGRTKKFGSHRQRVRFSVRPAFLSQRSEGSSDTNTGKCRGIFVVTLSNRKVLFKAQYLITYFPHFPSFCRNMKKNSVQSQTKPWARWDNSSNVYSSKPNI